MLVAEAYRVPNTNNVQSIANYESLVSGMIAENKSIVLGTDQNYDYLNTTYGANMELLNNFIRIGSRDNKTYQGN